MIYTALRLRNVINCQHSFSRSASIVEKNSGAVSSFSAEALSHTYF